jgi:hypothetical protein
MSSTDAPLRYIGHGTRQLAEDYSRTALWSALWVLAAVHLTNGVVAPLLLLTLVGVSRGQLEARE